MGYIDSPQSVSMMLRCNRQEWGFNGIVLFPIKLVHGLPLSIYTGMSCYQEHGYYMDHGIWGNPHSTCVQEYNPGCL